MRATTIQLYARGGVGDRENRYCGCFTVPCPDGDPRIPDLDEVGCGRFLLGESGTPGRSFFFADEIEAMVALAERQTGCFAEVDESWPYQSRHAAASRDECPGHPAGPGDPMGQTVYCDGSCVAS